MRPFQEAALETLAREGLLSPDALDHGWVTAGAEAVPGTLSARIAAANAAEAGLVEALTVLGSEYRLEGADGLKDRTGLIEYRYDAV